MRKHTLLLIVTLLFFAYAKSICYAYGDKHTHPALTSSALSKSELQLFLIYNLGIPNGLDQKYSTKTIRKIISEGSTNEDLKNRANNHFWNPIRNEGLEDRLWGWFGWEGTFYAEFGNLEWAMETPMGACDPDKLSESDECNDYSWKRAREVYYQTLINPSDARYVFLFEQLGRITHLLQDMAVPAHTRNDLLFGHLSPTKWSWEGEDAWAKFKSNFGNLYEASVDKRITGDSRLNWPANPTYIENLASEAVIPRFMRPEDYWDQGVYEGANPSDTISGDIGLAEYSNANFLSASVKFTNKYDPDHKDYFPYPRIESLAAEDQLPKYVTAEDNINDWREYVQKVTDGEYVEKFAHRIYFMEECLDESLDMSRCHSLGWELDNTVHQSYAERLIPMAVGYSAGLIDYFFRGKIEISQPLDGAYSVSTDPFQGFDTIKLSASNTSPEGEDLINGAIKLVVKFKTALNNTFEGEMPVLDANAGFTYLVADEANSVTSILRSADPDSPTVLTFNLPSNIPLSATDLQLYLVYKGTLGNETGGIAVGYKDISEPTAFDVINSMDWVCIDNAWHQTGLDAHILSDRDNNGFPDFDAFPHHISSLNISLTSADTTATPTETTRDLRYENLATGSIVRNYVLVDQQFTINYGNLFYTPDMAEDTMWNHSQAINGSIPDPLTAVSIQQNPTDGTYTNDGWEPFRGITTHNALRIMMGEDTCNYNDPGLPSLIFTPSINQQ